MSPFLSSFLESLSEFELRQTMGVEDGPESGSITKFFKHTGYETLNEYQIVKKNDEIWGSVEECHPGNITLYSLKKAFLGSRRPTKFVVKNNNDRAFLYIKRPFYLIASTSVVQDRNNRILGYVSEQFDFFKRKYQIRGANKKLLGLIDSTVLKLWTFPVLDLRKKEIAMIEKKMPKFGEFMTYRETLHIKCDPCVSPEAKMMILVTGLVLCMDLFEGKRW